MNEIFLDELIGNIQTYELRRCSQVKEETKKDQGFALKAVESDYSDLDEEEMAMITLKLKKFFKNARGNLKGKYQQTKEQWWCGKHDHIMKNCPVQKEEHGPEHFQNCGKRLQRSSSVKRFSKAMTATWGETSEELGFQEEEEVAVALMAKS